MEQLDLHVERQRSHLLEEQRVALGLFELPGGAIEGAGERAFFMAEQCRFDSIGRRGAAMQRQHLLAAARRGDVDRLRDHLLAGTILAFDQHRHARPRRLGGNSQSASEFGGGADDFFERQRLDQLFRHGPKLAMRAPPVGGRIERGKQTVGRQRFDQEIAGPGAHRIDGDRNAGLGGQDQQRKVRTQLTNMGDKLAALGPG